MNKGGNQKKINHRLYLIFFGLLTLTITIFVFLIVQDRQSKNKNIAVCSSSKNQAILTEASKYLNPIQSNKLSNVVQKIIKLDKYNQDPNCDYIMLSYYLSYDYSNAQYYFDQLNKYYSPNNGYSPIISKQVMSFSDLQFKLNNAKATDNELKNNTFYVRGNSK